MDFYGPWPTLEHQVVGFTQALAIQPAKVTFDQDIRCQLVFSEQPSCGIDRVGAHRVGYSLGWINRFIHCTPIGI